MDDTTWTTIIVILSIMVAITYQKYTKTKADYDTIDGPTVKKNLAIKEKYIEDLENEIDGYREEKEEMQHEINEWKGRHNQKGTISKYPGDKFDLAKNDDIKALVANLLEDGSKAFPQFAEILKDSKIKDRIINYAAENPEQAKQYLTRFLNPRVNAPGAITQSSPIPNFDSKNAI